MLLIRRLQTMLQASAMARQGAHITHEARAPFANHTRRPVRLRAALARLMVATIQIGAIVAAWLSPAQVLAEGFVVNIVFDPQTWGSTGQFCYSSRMDQAGTTTSRAECSSDPIQFYSYPF